MDKQLREQIKHDRFVEEVSHTVEYLSGHRDLVKKWGGVAAAVLVAVLAGWFYMNSQKSARQEDIRKAYAVADASVGEQPGPGQHFKTQAEKDAAILKAFNEVAAKHAGTREGYIAMMHAAEAACDQGKEADCETAFRKIADGSDADMSALAKLSLATLYSGQGKQDQAEALLRQLVDRPTALVSKEQAQITLARTISRTKPADARKILETLQKDGADRPGVSRTAIAALGDLNNQK